MKFFNRLASHPSYGLLVLRLAVGLIFIIHGVLKWQVWSATPGPQMSANMLNLMKFLSVVEPLGGLALLFGFLTQLAAAGLALIMIGAIYMKLYVWHFGFISQTTIGAEFDVVLLAANICLFVCGGGVIAVDHFFMKKHHQ